MTKYYTQSGVFFWKKLWTWWCSVSLSLCTMIRRHSTSYMSPLPLLLSYSAIVYNYLSIWFDFCCIWVHDTDVFGLQMNFNLFNFSHCLTSFYFDVNLLLFFNTLATINLMRCVGMRARSWPSLCRGLLVSTAKYFPRTRSEDVCTNCGVRGFSNSTQTFHKNIVLNRSVLFREVIS